MLTNIRVAADAGINDMGGDGGNDHGLFAWRTVIATAITVIIGLSGWTLHTISEHSSALTHISDKVDSLTQVVQTHNTEIDASLKTLLEDDRTHTAAIARHDQEFADLEQRRAEAIAPRVLPPSAIPEIGTAVERFFGLHPHRRMLSRRGSLGR
jgi:hypothetical protein